MDNYLDTNAARHMLQDHMEDDRIAPGRLGNFMEGLNVEVGLALVDELRVMNGYLMSIHGTMTMRPTPQITCTHPPCVHTGT